jgi:uncharacterized protein involved in outer membrane biogenesis
MLDKPGADGGLHVEADVSDPGTRWQFSSIRASLAESELTGDIEIGQRGERRFFGGTVAVTNVQHPEEEQQSESEATLSEVLPAGDLFSNLLDFTEKFDADFRFLAKESTLWGVPFEQLELHALLDRGALAAEVEKAYIREAALSANFHVTPQDEQTVLELNASLEDAPLAALIGGVNALDGVTGRFDGNLELRASGEDTSSVLNSTAGRVVLFLEDGEMPDELATRLSGDLLTAMFENFDKEDTTPIRCAIVVLSVDEGIARSQQMFLDTGPVNLYGKGDIRLGERRLDIELVPRAKDFSLVSMRLPLRFHGPFGDIKFDPDVSRGVESLLTPIELGREEDSSCAAPPMSAANQ